MQETLIDPHEREHRKPQLGKWTVLLALLVLLPWLLLIGGGITMCVLYAPGERIGTAGYVILAIMILPWLVANAWAMILCWRWEQYLDLDCISCGRPFFSKDLPELRQNGCCPACGQAVSVEDLQDLE
jgi:hypothetical protein